MKVQKPDFTATELRELLTYDPVTGAFFDAAGLRKDSLTKVGYRRVNFRSRWHRAHRMAWLWMTGEWPAHEIDHRNTDKGDNAWTNLRPATRGLNQENRTKAHKHSQTGVLGVFPLPNGRFTSCINVDKKKRHLGSFATIEEASAAYLAAKREWHAGCTL